MIRIEPHALERMVERGISPDEVEIALEKGQQFPAKHGRYEFRYTFDQSGYWNGRRYVRKMLRAFVIKEAGEWIVITAMADYQKK